MDQVVQDRRSAEVFTFGTLRFDVGVLRELAEACAIGFERGHVEIVAWAERVLLLARADPARRDLSPWVRLNRDFLAQIGAERLREPIYVAETEFGHLIIDGNHRVAKAYLAGVDQLEAIIFDKEAVRRAAVRH